MKALIKIYLKGVKHFSEIFFLIQQHLMQEVYLQKQRLVQSVKRGLLRIET